MLIEEFKDELRGLINILNEIKKPGTIERTRKKWNINEIKNETRRKLNTLDDEIYKHLDLNLKTLELRCIFCENPYEN